MEATDAPSSTNPSTRTAADPPPDEPTLQLPSEAPTSITTTMPSSSAPSVSLSSPSPSSTASPSQPQSQSSLHQRQPVASRTRSQTQLGQSAFTQSTSSSASSSAPSVQRSGLAIGVPAILPHHARPSPSLGYSYGSSSNFSQPLMSSSSPSPSFSQPLGGFPRGSVPLAEQSSGSIAPSPSFSQPFSAMPRSSSGIPDQQPSSNSQCGNQHYLRSNHALQITPSMDPHLALTIVKGCGCGHSPTSSTSRGHPNYFNTKFYCQPIASSW
ncbi:putative protein TPRXL [Dendrobium catenatum]|uniref:putative protein TPRXL n=1 Tax=Dendrobium catenatum TaxID=906689 RepID=UPI00109F3317|nr:putative protein TPRXL [Dendrobium catenatum]